MNVNDLCTLKEHEAGYSAHYSSFGIIIMYKSKIWMEVSTEEELHDILDSYI